MIRDCLSHSFPDAISTKLSAQEEEHLVGEAMKILSILQDKGVGLKKAGRVYADAIYLEFRQNTFEKSSGIKKSPQHLQGCLVCCGTNKRPSQK